MSICGERISEIQRIGVPADVSMLRIQTFATSESNASLRLLAESGSFPTHSASEKGQNERKGNDTYSMLIFCMRSKCDTTCIYIYMRVCVLPTKTITNIMWKYKFHETISSATAAQNATRLTAHAHITQSATVCCAYVPLVQTHLIMQI